MRLFVALKYRPFALLWLGRTISSLGDGVFLVALAWFVLTTTGSASANGVILICETVPMLLLTLIGGALVDRVSRRSLLLTSDIVRGVVVAAIAVLAWRHLLAFWQLALLCMGLPISVVGVGTAIFVCGAALGVLNLVWANTLQEIVPADLLGRVSSVDGLGSYALLPVGYGLAGFAADHIGASTVFLVGGAASVILIGLGLLHPDVRAFD